VKRSFQIVLFVVWLLIASAQNARGQHGHNGNAVAVAQAYQAACLRLALYQAQINQVAFFQRLAYQSQARQAACLQTAQSQAQTSRPIFVQQVIYYQGPAVQVSPCNPALSSLGVIHRQELEKQSGKQQALKDKIAQLEREKQSADQKALLDRIEQLEKEKQVAEQKALMARMEGLEKEKQVAEQKAQVARIERLEKEKQAAEKKALLARIEQLEKGKEAIERDTDGASSNPLEYLLLVVFVLGTVAAILTIMAALASCLPKDVSRLILAWIEDLPISSVFHPVRQSSQETGNPYASSSARRRDTGRCYNSPHASRSRSHSSDVMQRSRSGSRHPVMDSTWITSQSSRWA
jgi:hypothetical protein